MTDDLLSQRFTYASLVLTLIALGGVLKLDLLVGMLAVCASFALVRALPGTWLFRKTGCRGQVVASVVVAAVPVLALAAAGIALSYLGTHASTAYVEVMQEVGRIVLVWRNKLPAALAAHLPSDQDALKPWLAAVVKSQSAMLAGVGKSSAHGLLMSIVGVVIGLLMANGKAPANRGPLAQALVERAGRLQTTFSAIVMAQIWIAGFNTVMAAIFFFVALPLFGASMPYATALLLLTFFAGLLPVVGNLLCNTVTTVVALSVGPLVAVAALVFLVVIHKLEYFINAKVVGTKMSMAAWEILAAMFTMEALFGIPGLVSAPFFYAYIKLELRNLHWV